MSKKAKRTHINNDDSTEEHEDFMRMLGTFMGRHKLKLDEAASCALICGFDALLISLKRRPEKDLSWENFSIGNRLSNGAPGRS